MSYNSQWDSLELQPLAIPYDRITGELQDTPRFVRGKNTYVTTGNKVVRRLGTVQLTAPTVTGYRCDRLWCVETLDTPPCVYLVASMYNESTSLWEIWHQRQTSTPSAWAKSGTYRSMDHGQAPHEAVVQRGLLFIKTFPTSASGEKLGTVIFDGTGGTVTIKPWGALGPVTPVALNNAMVGTITASLSASATSIAVNITAGSLPSTPFVIQIDYEQIQVGSKSGSGPAYTFGSLTRGYNGTIASTHQVNAMLIYRNWTASAHLFTVNQFWSYAYAWKSITGQYTNRSPFQTNPDSLPDQTGPFFNQLPQITVQGLADTTNFPSIGIFRTTDGGGTYYWIQDITNTGAGAIQYTDDTLASSAGNEDPLPDSQLDTATVAPSLTSNSPPPAVLAPLVTGVATPAQSTPIASYQSRLWYGIGNVLFFSAEEELTMGIPEESWPSGLFGNFFRFQYPITNVAATPNNLYVFTLKATYIITGTNLQTFAAQLILGNIGHPYGHARACDVFYNAVVFMTHDYRIAIISDGDQNAPIILSDPLFSDLVDTINSNSAVFDIKYWGDLDKELIFVSGYVQATPSLSQQWVFDVKKSIKPLPYSSAITQTGPPFWNLPWSYPATAQISCRISETSSQRRMVFYSWDGSTNGAFARIDPTYITPTDYTYAGTVTFDIDMVFALTRVPAGDHVNQRRVPMVTPVIYSISFERTSFAGDTDPQFYYFTDDLWTDPISVNASVDPPRRPLSKSYKTIEFPLFVVGQRVAWELAKIQSTDRFELQNVIVTFSPDSGS